MSLTIKQQVDNATKLNEITDDFCENMFNTLLLQYLSQHVMVKTLNLENIEQITNLNGIPIKYMGFSYYKGDSNLYSEEFRFSTLKFGLDLSIFMNEHEDAIHKGLLKIKAPTLPLSKSKISGLVRLHDDGGINIIEIEMNFDHPNPDVKLIVRDHNLEFEKFTRFFLMFLSFLIVSGFLIMLLLSLLNKI